MKQIRFTMVLFLIFSLLLFPAAAKSVQKEYTADAGNPTVDANQVFSSFLSEVDESIDVDITIHGVGADWYFAYDNIFKNTGRWQTFTAKADVLQVKDSPMSEKFQKTVRDADALYLDFPDEEHYAGSAEISVNLPAEYAGQSVWLYEYDPKTDANEETLVAVGNNITVNEQAQLVLMQTESHDYLLVLSKDAQSISGDLSKLCNDVVLSTGRNLFADVSWPVLVLAIVIILLVIGAVVFGIIVLVRSKKKEKAEKEHNRPIEIRLNDLPPKK